MTEVDAQGATISLGDDIEGYLRASEIARDKIEDATAHLKVGDDVEAKVLNVDRKNRVISLSIRALEVEEEKAAIRELRQQETEQAGPATIGDLIKAQMESQDK